MSTLRFRTVKISQIGFLVYHYVDKHDTYAACILDLKDEVAFLR